jgi:hypothetical protein
MHNSGLFCGQTSCIVQISSTFHLCCCHCAFVLSFGAQIFAVLQVTSAVRSASGVLSGSELVHVPDTINKFYVCLSHLFPLQTTVCIQVTVYLYFVLFYY